MIMMISKYSLERGDIMHNIGYRIRLPSEPNLCENFIKRYSEYFKTFELKVSEEILCDSILQNIIYCTEKYGISFWSFHVFKDALYNEESYYKTTKFCELLEKQKTFFKFSLITHFVDDSYYFIPKMQGNNYEIVLENVEVESGIIEYMTALKQFAIKYNVKICLDLGHLLYSSKNCNINILEWLLQDEWWINNIVEFHIHDYNSQKCHLNIGTGLLKYQKIDLFLQNFKQPFLIIETKIHDLSSEGVSEKQLLEEML